MKFWKILGYTLVALVLWGCSTDDTTDPVPTPTATIQGNVSSFVPVSGLSTQQLAGIDVSVQGTSITTTTDDAGNFTLDDVPVGNVVLLFASVEINASLTIENVEEGQIVVIDVQVSATLAVIASIERDTEDYSFDLDTTNFTLDDDDDDTDDNADDTVVATIAGTVAALADIDLDSLELSGDSGSLAPTNAVIVGGQLQAEFNVAALLDVVGDVAGQFEVGLSFQANNITVNVSVFISVEVSIDDGDDGDNDDSDDGDSDDGDSDDSDGGDSDDGDSDDSDGGDSDDSDDGDSDDGDSDDSDDGDSDDDDSDDSDDGDSDDSDDGDSDADDGDADDGDVTAPITEVGIVIDVDISANVFVISGQGTDYTIQLSSDTVISQSDDGGLTSVDISVEVLFQLLQAGVQVQVDGNLVDGVIVAISITVFVDDIVDDNGDPVEDDYDFHVQPDTWNTNYEGNTNSNVAFRITSDDDGAIDDIDLDSIRISIDSTAIPSEIRQQGANQLRALLTRAEAYALIDRPIPGQDYIVTISFTVASGATVELVDVIDLVGPGQDDGGGDVNVVIDVDIDINNSDSDEGTITVPGDDGDDVDVHIDDDTDIIVIDPVTQETVSISIDVFFQIVVQGGISLDLDLLTTVEGTFALEIYFEFSIGDLPDDGDDGDDDDDDDDFDAVDVDVDDVDEDNDSFSFTDSDGVSITVGVGVNTEIVAVDPVTGESVTISADVFFQLLLEGNITLDIDLDDGDNGDGSDDDDSDDSDDDDDDGDSDDSDDDDGDSDDNDDGDSDDGDGVSIVIAIKIIVNIDLSLLPSETPDFALTLEPTEWGLDWVDNTEETLAALISLDDMMDDDDSDDAADDGDSDDSDDADLLDNIDTSTIMLSILDGTTAIMPTDVSLTDDGLEALFIQADAFGLLDDPMVDDVVTVLVSFEYGDDDELIELEAEITVVDAPLPVFTATLEPTDWALDWPDSDGEVVVTVTGEALADVDLDSFELSAMLAAMMDDGTDDGSDDGMDDGADDGMDDGSDDGMDDDLSDDFPAGVPSVEVNADDNSIQVLFAQADVFNLLMDPEADDAILALLTFDLLDDREIEILLDAVVVAVPDILLSEEALETDESGTEATFEVVLATEPTAPVNITLSFVVEPGDEVEGELSTDSLEFDDTNWDVPVTITVTGLDDEEEDGDVTYQISLESTSNDPDYDELIR
ncbi:MAG: hypothetical protein AAF708_03690, partial [Deinococcota bacterium]